MHNVYKLAILDHGGDEWKAAGGDLLGGNGLGQVPWTVDVVALHDGDVVGQQLDRDDCQDAWKESLLGAGLFGLYVI